MSTITETVTDRCTDEDDAPVVVALATAAVTDAPHTQPDADTLADLAELLNEMGGDHADTSGSAEDIVDRAADSHYARGALIDLTSYVIEKEGGDTWGIGQEFRSVASVLSGAARDLA